MPGESLPKAYISLLIPSSDGPKGPTGKTVTFRFNPKEYSIQKSASWDRKPAKGAKKTSMGEFKGAEPRVLNVEVFLDASDDKGDVKKGAKGVGGDIETLFSCLVPHASTMGSKHPLPPFVRFGWGSKVLLTGTVKSVNAKYTMFRPDGTPIRATATVAIEELPGELAKQNPTSGALSATRGVTVVEGDSLASVAYKEYGDPGMWRLVAEANDIDDPMRLAPGRHLLLPERPTTGAEAANGNGNGA
jgi:nucleoid-associated protein YgaU